METGLRQVIGKIRIDNFLRPVAGGKLETQLKNIIDKRAGKVKGVDASFSKVYNALKTRAMKSIILADLPILTEADYPFKLNFIMHIIPPKCLKRDSEGKYCDTRQICVKDARNAIWIYDKIIPDLLSGDRDTSELSLGVGMMTFEKSIGNCRFIPKGKPYIIDDSIEYTPGPNFEAVYDSKESFLIVEILSNKRVLC